MFQVAKSQKLQYANFYYQKFTMIKTEDHSYFNSTTTKEKKTCIFNNPLTLSFKLRYLVQNSIRIKQFFPEEAFQSFEALSSIVKNS